MRSPHEHTPAGGGSHERGQALLEFALVTPILALLLMAIFQFAFVLQAQMGLTNAVREAARRAAATTSTDAASLEGWTVNSELLGGTGLLASNVQGYTAARLPAGSPPTAHVCGYSVSTGSSGVTGQMITVTVTYDYPVFFPLLSFALPGNSGGDWQLSASAQMRLENPFGSAPSC